MAWGIYSVEPAVVIAASRPETAFFEINFIAEINSMPTIYI